MLTASLRQQHAELSRLLGDIGAAAKNGQPGTELRRLLIELSGKLTVHLAAEDRLVYPQLQASPDMAVASMARRFADEMGGLGAAFKSFTHRYATGIAIDADRAGFNASYAAIVAAISARVKAEETELYPAADRVGKA
ncbi:MAG: hemerythrin domain-containing protein [Planctomycetes bacterium]|nr:hemerythrin domain-containing protein [Planctomycetota bacterium]